MFPKNSSCLFVVVSIYLFFYLSVCLSVCLSVYLPTYLPIYLSNSMWSKHKVVVVVVDSFSF